MRVKGLWMCQAWDSETNRMRLTPADPDTSERLSQRYVLWLFQSNGRLNTSCFVMLLCSHLISLHTGRWSSQNYVKRLRRTVQSPATLRVYNLALYTRKAVHFN